MRRETRLFGDDGRVDVHDGKFFSPHDRQNFLQQFAARNILVTRFAVGKMKADVAFAERAEKRVDERVQEHVGVGMSGESGAVRNFDAAQHELAPALKPVRVEAVADAKIGWHKRISDFDRSSRERQRHANARSHSAVNLRYNPAMWLL